MSPVRSQFLGGFCNASTDPVLLWLEPWAEEFELPAKSSVVLQTPVGQPAGLLESIEQTPDHIVIWASATVEVCIDGAIQDSASASISAPNDLSKQMLEILFVNQPSARLGGAAHMASGPSWWQRLRQFFAN